MFDTDDESPEVKLDPFLFFGTVTVVDLGILRRDAQRKYKRELDALYALGEPQLEKTAKL